VCSVLCAVDFVHRFCSMQCVQFVCGMKCVSNVCAVRLSAAWVECVQSV